MNQNELLKQTSRSFYLTLRVLPRAVRRQIGLAYLLARTTDTIADTELVPLDQRLNALSKLRDRISGKNRDALQFGELARHQASCAEKTLLEKADESVALLEQLSSRDAELIRKVLGTITSGQELDLRRFSTTGARTPSSAVEIICLATDAELDDYTYRVAGCVGEFWTDMCIEHLFTAAEIREMSAEDFRESGIRFGKGLQLVNILRDLPADLRKGRCYAR